MLCSRSLKSRHHCARLMFAFLGASTAFGGAKNASRPWAGRAHKPASKKHVSLWSQEGASYCGGEYSLCTDGSCALTQSACGKCATGQYVCPLSTKCMDSLDEYAASCPDLKGTHYDWTLSEDERLDAFMQAVSLTDMISQLKNDAPALDNASLPAYNWLNDNEHGVKGTANATVYPMGVSIGGAWSKELTKAVGAAIGVESRSTHNARADKSGDSCGSTSTGQVTSNGCGITLYAPNINLVRDPRWGRAEEVYSEDPHLSGELAVAMVTGMQGNAEGETTAEDGGALMSGACCKHYAVYQNEDKPEARTSLDAAVGARALWETYLPVMEACVARAKATHVMCSYNAVNGKPTCAHPELLDGILRAQWDFDGFVVSDYDAWKNLVDTHHYAANWSDAAAKGLNAGLDQEGGFGSYDVVDAIPTAIASGATSATTVRAAFRRLMRIRLRLGMLDPPSLVAPMNASYVPERQCETDARLALAQRAAREGIVLLQNKNGALPLQKSGFVRRAGSNGSAKSIGSLALVGPQADDWRVLVGAANYAFANGPSRGVVTVLQGLRRALGGDAAALTHVDGCADVPCATADVAAATAAAAASSATVVLLGDWFGAASGWPLCSAENDGCEAEAHDRSVIELPGKQLELLTALRAALGDDGSKPLVCVVVSGGALALGDAAAQCDALLLLWPAGQQGGAALADVLFGDFSPAGRLPVTFYGATADLPPMGAFDEYPNATAGHNGTTYRHYVGPAPTFRFGDGLSYTTFAYSALSAPATAAACDALTVRVTVSNTGDVASDEVVQLYVATPDSSVPSPRIRLAAFERLAAIPPGRSVTVTLTVDPSSHAVVIPPDPSDPAASVYTDSRRVEAGTLEIYVGGSQPKPSGGTLFATTTITTSSMLRGERGCGAP